MFGWAIALARKRLLCGILFLLHLNVLTMAASAAATPNNIIRFASFNVALQRDQKGQLIADLSTPDNAQARNIAEIIQRVRPDVLLLNEFDYDADQQALALFQHNYLAQSQRQQPPIDYPYLIAFAANTGVSSGIDLDSDGHLKLPNDAFAYGLFPGQYAFALLSMHPIDSRQIRSWQTFLWSAMPAAKLPTDYYSPQAQQVLRLSSKNHVDVPIQLPNGVIHILACHPTPPVFDGPEDRNGRRNYDEIRLFADYISADKSAYLVDDQGRSGGLASDQHFVIMGDLNADPNDGESTEFAIQQLLNHPRINQSVARGTLIPSSEGGKNFAAFANRQRRGNPAFVTASFNGGLRVDYVLPSQTLQVTASGIFWPDSTDPLYRLIKDKETSSDHRLVWVDVEIPPSPPFPKGGIQ